MTRSDLPPEFFDRAGVSLYSFDDGRVMIIQSTIVSAAEARHNARTLLLMANQPTVAELDEARARRNGNHPPAELVESVARALDPEKIDRPSCRFRGKDGREYPAVAPTWMSWIEEAVCSIKAVERGKR